jgi:phage repressor protein C with HTH and peptisase S24 domain
MEKKDRLLSLIDHYSGGNKSEFARMIGVSPQAVSTWITRNTFDIDIIYAKCLNISPDWLLTGKGNMLKGEETEDASAPVVSYDPKVGQPFYNVDFLGGFSEVYNSQVSVPDRNIIVPGFDRAKLWCNVTGHSMEPKINHGDIIALRPCTLDDIQYGEIYAVVLDTIRTIKILRKGTSKNSLRYVPINPNFDEQEFAVKRIINIFEVIGSISKFF